MISDSDQQQIKDQRELEKKQAKKQQRNIDQRDKRACRVIKDVFEKASLKGLDAANRVCECVDLYSVSEEVVEALESKDLTFYDKQLVLRSFIAWADDNKHTVAGKP